MDTNARTTDGIFDKERHDLVVQVDNQRMQLISPPPEEILSLQWATQAGVVSKRKRAPPTPVKSTTSTVADKAPETTPNPKPKKVVVQSPHAQNLHADYIPALVLSGDQGQELERATNPSVRRVLFSARRPRRSATPIPPYEPPPDIFTPPREVFMSPAPTRSAPKRKGSVGRQTRARTKGKELRVNTNVRVKQEMPDGLDLLAPMPPPSPTDDPLLLSGPPELEPASESQGSTEPDDEFQEEPQNGELLVPIEVQGEDVPALDDSQDDEGNDTADELLLPIEVQGEDVPTWDDSQDDEGTDTADESDLVKIVSADPRAAARAVAILKQHDYDCYTKLVKKRRASQSALADFAKEYRRKDVSSSGVLKTADQRRRRLTMGVIGDEVIIPGSPITTLPDLLQQAEEEITHPARRSARSTTTSARKHRDPFRTPTSVKFIDKGGSITPKRYPVGPREWTKEDWKLLDACFTDQRINPRDPHDMLAAVDAVALEAVVARFIDIMGGQSLINTFGESWSRDNLMERTKALLKKQRSGNVAPPTTPISSLSLTPLSFAVPDFTPTCERRQGLPPTLLAPRYSHLLEEAAAINVIGPSSDQDKVASRVQQIPDIPFDCSPDFAQELSPQRLSVPLANNLGNCFRGFFSSYLPILSKSSKKTHVQGQPYLPLPLPSVIQKPRGPVETPARPLIPRAPHPKDQVHLNHISLKPSKIPRTKPNPKRLVELVPVPQTLTKPETMTPRDGVVPRPRRSSGNSVKDLVRGFEQMDKSTDRKFGTRAFRQGQVDLRPKWKP